MTLRDTWNDFRLSVAISPYSIYEIGLVNTINFADLFTNTTFSGLSQYTYPQILAKYPYFEEKNNKWVQVKHMQEIVDSLWATYSESYCCLYDYNCNATDEEKATLEKDAVKKFYSILFSILDDTWDKYTLLLDTYESNRSKLLDAVQTRSFGDNSRTAEGESSGTRSGTTSGTTSSTATTTYNTTDNTTTNEEASGSDVSEVKYNSSVANTRSSESEVTSYNAMKDTPQVDIDVRGLEYNSQNAYSNNTTEESGSSTDTRSGTDTTTTTYGKEIDKTDVHTKTGTEAVSQSGTTSSTDGETTSGTNNSSESSDYENTTLDDRDTLMARIDEIDNKYKALIRKWANEFRALFWEVVENEE